MRKVPAVEREFHAEMGKRIARLRRRMGVSQLELAKRIGISRPTLSNLEAGRAGTSAYRTHLICRALGCDMDDLMPNRPLADRTVPVTFVVTVGTKSARFQHTF